MQTNLDPEAGAPWNLDAMTSDELWEIWRIYHRAGPKLGRQIFPSNPPPKHYVKTLWQLAAYASNKAVAQDLRIKGEIDRATVYETICENIYSCLPEYARW